MSVPPMNIAGSNPGAGSTFPLSSRPISEEPPAANPVEAPDPKIDAAEPRRIADSPNVEPVTAFDVAAEPASVLSSPRQQPEDLKQKLVDSDKLGGVSIVQEDGGKLPTAAAIAALPVGEKVTTTPRPGDRVGDHRQQESTEAAKVPSPKSTPRQSLARDAREDPLLQSWQKETLNQTAEAGAVGALTAVENAAAADAAAGPPLNETPIDHLEFNVADKRQATSTTSWAEDVLCEEEKGGEESEMKAVEEEVAVDQPKTIVAASDIVPTEKSLVAYCEVRLGLSVFSSRSYSFQLVAGSPLWFVCGIVSTLLVVVWLFELRFK